MASDNPTKFLKVVLLGESGVGKTSIINRYTFDTFDSNYNSTAGAAFLSRTVAFPEHNVNIKYNLWDTAGQEKYHTMIKIFYRDSNAIALVYSITSKTSFEALRKYWYPEVSKECSPKTILVVCANKADLYEDEQVSDQEGKEYAKEINAFYVQTSAKTKNGIESMFQVIGERFISPDKEIAPSDLDNKNTSNGKKVILGKNTEVNAGDKKKKDCCK